MMLLLLSGLLVVALLLTPLCLFLQSRKHQQQLLMTAEVTSSNLTPQIAYLQKLLEVEKERVQSLLNQVQSKDPMTLANLQSITTSQGLDSEYVATGDADEALRYEELIGMATDGLPLPPGFTDVTDLNNDLTDAGFSPIGTEPV